MLLPSPPVRRAAPALLVIGVLLLAGCTGKGVEDAPATGDAAGLASLAGVTNATGGNVAVTTDNGLVVTPDPENATLRVGLAPSVYTHGVFQACRDACLDVTSPPGMILAEEDLVAVRNVSVNALGPDRTGMIAFYNDGAQAGEFLRWYEPTERFQASDDLESDGNLTAVGGTVGTANLIVLDDGQRMRVRAAAQEGLEPVVFLRGSATLTGESVAIALPPEFQALMGNGRLTVQVTPTNYTATPLYVKEKAGDHVTIATAPDNTADIPFDYTVQASRHVSAGYAPLELDG